MKSCIWLFIYNHDHWGLIRFTQSDTSSTQFTISVMSNEKYRKRKGFDKLRKHIFSFVFVSCTIIGQYWCSPVFAAHNMIFAPIAHPPMRWFVTSTRFIYQFIRNDTLKHAQHSCNIIIHCIVGLSHFSSNRPNIISR